jgi:hypothetical protein
LFITGYRVQINNTYNVSRFLKTVGDMSFIAKDKLTEDKEKMMGHWPETTDD